MDFENLQKTWESFGQKDPLWSILTWEGKADNQWDPEEFFQVGFKDVAHILAQAKHHHPAPIGGGKSLDFGCGVGRLTIPLAAHFEESHGVDISAPMIALANQFKAERAVANCEFHLNARNDLQLFADDNFDFILSLIVLQHMEPQYFLNYIREFIRVLKRDGMLVFQLPDELEWRAEYDTFTEETGPAMEMFGMASEQVAAFLQDEGATVIDIVEDQSCGPGLRSYRYFVTK